MKFYLIRHGRTDWNDLNHIQGKSDIPLNDTGIAQAKELADIIKADKLPIKHIYSSPLKRATQTADILAAKLGLTYHILDDLREVDLGLWEGHTWAEIAEQYPGNYNEWRINRRYTKVHGGESYDDMFIRSLKALKELAATHSDDVAIVTHSAVIMALLCYFDNAPFELMKNYKVHNASITILDSSQVIEA
ncbi:MAG: histidine phosphatase family protein [Lachnospiraceae bacterium]|nr:histidine phosphatase family protein [Lachnospiraceae bacterium]